MKRTEPRDSDDVTAAFFLVKLLEDAPAGSLRTSAFPLSR